MFSKKKRVVDHSVLARVREKPCCVCGNRPVDASHIRPRSLGGPDSELNVVPHCRPCHRRWHSLGPRRFCALYPKFQGVLSEMGWVWVLGRLRHPSIDNPELFQ